MPRPIAGAVALAMAAWSAPAAASGPAFNAAWIQQQAGRQAAADAARIGTMTAFGATLTARQIQQLNEQTRLSIANLGQVAQAAAAAAEAQRKAREDALRAGGGVPDGFAEGGLKVDGNPLTAGWSGADRPTQSVDPATGRVLVGVRQTSERALLNWETFNIGRNTALHFDQQSNWAVLNRVNDPLARPSQIQGQLSGAGTVMVLNRNGIVFSGTSQVDTGNLVAAAARMSDAQFRDNGLYSAAATSGFAPSFTDAGGKLIVEAGAQLSTRAPQSATQGGGYALLAGSEVHNAGTINTPRGQAQLAAGDAFIVRRGYGSDGNQVSTTRGNEIAVQRLPGSAAGAVTNTGVIQAERGDITLAGHAVRQDGVAVATTSVSQRGTIHLLNSAGDADGSVTLGPGSVTAVLIEDSTETAVDGQRDALIKESTEQDAIRANGTSIPPAFDNLATLADRRDQSRVEIVSGANVVFERGSLTLATGGQVAVAASGRAFVAEGARLDVSGATAVKVAMESNNLKINVQGNEQRDAAGNRDSARLNNSDVWVDVRDLVFVPAGTNGYATDRYYTKGGLLEVGGYLGTTGHTAAEWAAVGGTLTLGGKEVVTQAGSSINLAGGSLAYQDGMVRTSWVRGPDGRLYDVSRAPGDILYSGIYKGFEVDYARWGVTDRFYNVALAPAARWQRGYLVGRDAGKLVINSATPVLEGDIQANVLQGERQTGQRLAGISDGYKVTGNTVALAGQLALANLNGVQPRPYATEVVFGEVAGVTAGMGAGDALPAGRTGHALFDAAALSRAGLGGLSVESAAGITVNAPLTLARGGELRLVAPHIEVAAALTAQAGSIRLGNIYAPLQLGLTPASGDPMIVLAEGAVLNTRGAWANLWLDPDSVNDLAYLHGGSVVLDTTGGMDLRRGSVIDTSSGGAVLVNGKRTGGRGGDVTLQANRVLASTGTPGSAAMTLDGTVRGYGVTGGKLTLASREVLIGGADSAADAAGMVRLGEDFFRQGFSAYDINGYQGLTVAPGARLSVEMPVYRFHDDAHHVAGGADPSAAMTLWTPPAYLDDPARGRLSQRGAATLTLKSVVPEVAVEQQTASAKIQIGTGARLGVDAGSSIALSSPGQITIDGRLDAWGGEIAVLGQNTTERQAQASGHARSIWIGDNAVLDVAARAETRRDAAGRIYGLVPDGGRIVIGARGTQDDGQVAATDSFIVLRPGAVLDASGTHAELDAVTGLAARKASGPASAAIPVASRGGTIAFSSYDGVYLDGTLRAHAGGMGAAGGTLAVSLETPVFNRNDNPIAAVLTPREIVLGQAQRASGLSSTLAPGAADPALAYGKAYLGVDKIEAGGFDNLSLLANGLLTFDGDVSLKLGQSLQLRQRVIGLAETSGADARIDLQAPYVLVGGVTSVGGERLFPVVNGGVSKSSTLARFGVRAGLIDVRDGVSFGVQETLALAGTSQSVDRRGFDLVALDSQGDIRFVAGSTNVVGATGGINTSLVTAGDLALTAAQVYPTTGANARALAGYTGSNSYADGRTLTVARNGADDPGAPLSLFGALILAAPHVEQGGIVRAPLGSLQLGTDGYGNARTESVRLLPGGITSVSAAGLVAPYGGTTDGVSYKYNGADVRFPSTPGGILLAGQSIASEHGSLLDLSGGGTVTGAAFVSGRGGSTDTLLNALMQYDRAGGSFTLPVLSAHPVYAIVPGAQAGAAPVAPPDLASGYAGSRPAVGQQITIPAGVPGLPAGTYTLMPAYYALLPGAYRVELGGAAPLGATGVVALPNGSYAATGTGSIANTGIRNAVPTQLTLTPGETVRKYSQYNETSYREFATADAARQGTVRPVLPEDARTLTLSFAAEPGSARALRMEGVTRLSPASGGYGGTAAVYTVPDGKLEVVGDDAGLPTTGYVSVRAGDLNALGAARLVVGGDMGTDLRGIGGSERNRVGWVAKSAEVILRDKATLSAPEVFLVSNSQGNVVVEAGAEINTLGKGAVAYDSTAGYFYAPDSSNVLAVSNGWLDFLPSVAGETAQKRGRIEVGACAQASCGGKAGLYSDGTITVATAVDFNLHDNARFGTRNLVLSVPAVHIGNDAALAGAAAGGLKLTQGLLDRLLNGDPEKRAPALESLVLAAGELDFYGSANLTTIDPGTGKSTLDQLVLTTPLIKGQGGAGDRAMLSTGTLVWNGVADAVPGAVARGAPGTGSGTLEIVADQIVFGYGGKTRPDTSQTVRRMALGFDTVKLTASERITANHKGSLAVYQAQGDYEAGKGYQYSGGNLALNTPLLSGEAGSVNALTAGGRLAIAAPAGARAAPVGAAALGAELKLKADRIDVAGTVALPSGKLTLEAEHDIALQDASRIDLAGRAKTFFDVTRYSWGGDLVIESAQGNVSQARGAVIDLSAQDNAAGSMSVTATAAGAGQVALAGSILGTSSGRYDAGGTLVPFQAGRIEVRAQALDDFSGLNQRLSEGGVTGARSFAVKQGDLVIGDGVKANAVSISVDGGKLTVNGTIDASGAQPGSIRLAARDGLYLASTAKLDAHGSELRVDSYGQAIDAPNRATVDLTVSGKDAMLTLAPGATIDLRAADNVARGTLNLNASRDAARGSDIRIDVQGTPVISGAKSIAVNAFWRYDDAPQGTPGSNGRPVQDISQGYLDRLDADSQAFMAAALGNASLQGRLRGLTDSQGGTLHVRPGVEIVSATADGDLRVVSDLDLSGYRYGPTANPALRGSGEPGALVIRAGGDLSIHGSINDGFAPPAQTGNKLDENGWVIDTGNVVGSNITVPGAMMLGAGTQFNSVRGALTFDIQIGASTLRAGVAIPVGVTLNRDYAVATDWIAGGDVRTAAGQVYHKGDVVPAGTLGRGTVIGTGNALPVAMEIQAMTWPKGAPLDALGGNVTLAASALLKAGDVIPFNTVFKVEGNLSNATLAQPLVLSTPVLIASGATFRTTETLNFGITAGSMAIRRGVVIPAQFVSGSTLSVPAGTTGWVATASIWSSTGVLLYQAGDTVAAPIPAGSIFGAGTTLPPVSPGSPGTLTTRSSTVPANVSLSFYSASTVRLATDTRVEAGAVIPAGTTQLTSSAYLPSTRPVGAGGTQGSLWAVAPMLPAGSQSWDMRLVAGADLQAADARGMRAASGLDGGGNLVMADSHYQMSSEARTAGTIFSVIRTGTGDLDMLAGGDLSMQSLFGVYTAGTQSRTVGAVGVDPYNQPRGMSVDETGRLGTSVLGANGVAYEALVGTADAYQAYYPDSGGNLFVQAQGDLAGQVLGSASTALSGQTSRQGPSASVGNWLWRQGGGDIPAAWWINFGTYAKVPQSPAGSNAYVVGFTGFGALGGGNVALTSGGDAGMIGRPPGGAVRETAPFSSALVAAVGSTGRVGRDGTLSLTGGGDLSLHVGGGLNTAYAFNALNLDNIQHDLQGALVDLRGSIGLKAGALGTIALNYGLGNTLRADPYTARVSVADGGIVVVPGDATVRLDTRGDLVLGGAADAGRVRAWNTTPSTANGTTYAGGGLSWFSLWTERTAIDLFAAGGNLTPSTQLREAYVANVLKGDYAATDGRFVYPGTLRAVAANGSLYYGSAVGGGQTAADLAYSLLLAPSAKGQLEFLAGNSIYGGPYAVDISGANPALLPSPVRPAYVGLGATSAVGNVSAEGVRRSSTNPFPLFALAADTASGTLHAGDGDPARFYALDGDIVDLRTGEILRFGASANRSVSTWLVGAKPVWIMAGRDILGAGTAPNTSTGTPQSELTYGQSTGNLLVHNNPSDISVVSAGRDIVHASFSVAGPGTLEVSAGRSILLEDKGTLASIGPVGAGAAGDRSRGAGIVIQAGAGAGGPDYSALSRRYLDPANRANADFPLDSAENAGKVAWTYEAELVGWLGERYQFAGTVAQALQYFGALPARQREVFLRQVYFSELRAGGREYNDAASKRAGSYLRGRQAIATLFPERDSSGQPIRYAGDFTMFGAAGVRTDFGGAIQLLAPGGKAVLGVEGVVPPASAGVVTQGAGDIQIYARGSVLLGQSRVMTTYGGDILGWSAEGDINAGRGSKTTLVYPPVSRVYDAFGNVTLAPTAPSSGAGIATLNPIPSILPGAVDLIAPLGTIDVGEAGIRVSGNVNLAALQVVNAANVQAQGSATGLQLAAAPNAGALASASAAASSATQTAQDALRQQAADTRGRLPSIVSVQVLGFGGDADGQ
ncbi:filamentous haemagglutinin family protein [Cupriavidus sp. USMAA2-4]|uniref:filamentous haemagglutinin family protein n=1 Tax=Cupriavidus sp. USMAA2-4 TaxID=876364 RepID=UPI0012F4DDCB|nr:filamentous haemagglutinin family protein [Cupriavidus sp. USMAA2-4]